MSDLSISVSDISGGVTFFGTLPAASLYLVPRFIFVIHNDNKDYLKSCPQAELLLYYVKNT